MSDMPSHRTFCHISDYTDRGYARLHRMVAVSNPVVLWAPSGSLLRKHAHVAPAHFIKLIEKGYIRVILREEWLKKNHRDKHSYQGARWDNEIDDAIYRIHLNERNEPDRTERKVIVAPREEGVGWAKDVAKLVPKEVEYWRGVLDSPHADKLIAAGSLEAIRRDNLPPDAAVARILRDLHNHEQAINQASAVAPFLLDPTEVARLKRSIEVDEYLQRTTGGAVIRTQTASANSIEPAALVDGLMGVIMRLERSAPGSGLMTFVGSEAHRELISWYRAASLLLDDHLDLWPQQVEQKFAQSLASRIGDVHRQNLSEALFGGWRNRAATAVGTAGYGLTVASLMNGQWLEGSVGVGVSAFATSLAWSKVRTTYSGETWPYYFAFSHAPNSQLRSELLDRLAEDR